MGFLFGNKSEKILKKCLDRSLVLHVNYADGSSDHHSEVVRFDKKVLVIKNFTEQLRENILEVRIRELNIGFETKVINITSDSDGNSLLHCTLPNELHGFGHVTQQYFVYPKGFAVVIPNERIGALEMSIWDMTCKGVDLVNCSSHNFEKGFRFFSSKINLDGTQAMVELEVIRHLMRRNSDQTFNIIRCKFVTLPKEMDELLAVAKELDKL